MRIAVDAEGDAVAELRFGRPDTELEAGRKLEAFGVPGRRGEGRWIGGVLRPADQRDDKAEKRPEESHAPRLSCGLVRAREAARRTAAVMPDARCLTQMTCNLKPET